MSKLQQNRGKNQLHQSHLLYEPTMLEKQQTTGEESTSREETGQISGRNMQKISKIQYRTDGEIQEPKKTMDTLSPNTNIQGTDTPILP